MIAGIFRSNQLLFAYGAVAVLSLGLVASSLLLPEPAALRDGEHLLTVYLHLLPFPVRMLLQAVMLVAGAVVFNQLLVNEKIAREYNSVFLLAYVIAASSHTAWRFAGGASIAGFLLLLVIRNLMVAGNSKKQLSLVFDAGFLGGLAYLIYEPAWVIFPMSLLGMVLGGFFRWRALMIWLFGYSTPIYLTAAVAYLADKNDWLTDMTPSFEQLYWFSPQLTVAQKALLAFALAMWIMGVLVSFTGVNLKTNALRNAQRFFFILLLCVFPALWLLPADGWMLAVMFVPVSAFYIGRFLEAVPNARLFNALLLMWLLLVVLPLLPIKGSF
ncbi:MAG: hypothetical protein C0424_00580 [Sphingobacteriaceae bacterium]|nr:hypothetical protein [Sphingobacteriaceae bacterium]